MLYIFGCALMSYLLYYKRYRIPHYLNFMYLNLKKIKNYSRNNGFLKTEEFLIPDTNTIILEYKYKKHKYIILGNKHSISFPPYNKEEIEQIHNDNSINSMIKTKDNIINAEIVYKNGNIKDVLDITQMLCDPICRFYKNKTNELNTYHLINFLKYKKLYEPNISYNVMLCDGTELNLLN